VAATLLRGNKGDAMAALFRDRLSMAILSLLPQAATVHDDDNDTADEFDVRIGGSFAVREYMLRSAATNPSMAARADWHPDDVDVFVVGKARQPRADGKALVSIIQDVVEKMSRSLGGLEARLKSPGGLGTGAKKSKDGVGEGRGLLHHWLGEGSIDILRVRPGVDNYPDEHGRTSGRNGRRVVSLAVPGLGKIDFVGCHEREYPRCADLVKSFDLSVCQLCAARVATSTDATTGSRMPVLQFEMTRRAQRDIASGTMTSTGAGRFSYKRIVKYVNRGFRYREVRRDDDQSYDEMHATDTQGASEQQAAEQAADWSECGPNDKGKLYYRSLAGFSTRMLHLLDNCVAAMPTLCLLPIKVSEGRGRLVAVPLHCYDPSIFQQQQGNSASASTTIHDLQRKLIRWISTCIVRCDEALSLAEIGDRRLVLKRLHEILADPTSFSAEVHRILDEEPLPSNLLSEARRYRHRSPGCGTRPIDLLMLLCEVETCNTSSSIKQ
jgi:hypothetical protein